MLVPSRNMSDMQGERRAGLAAGSAWRSLYVLGAIAALVALAGTLADIVITMIPGWEASTVPATVEQWFTQLHVNPWLGLRNLDLLNITVSAVGLPLYVALYGAHRNASPGYAALSLIIVALGTAVFIADNAALPMLELSRQYSVASTETQRSALKGAGEALLAKGAHGSMGAFVGSFLSSMGTLLMTVAMFKGRVFGRAAASTGMLGVSLLLVYLIGSTLTSQSSAILMAVAMPGGFLMIAWNLIVAKKLLQLGHAADDQAQSRA
jgi:MFS family permease